MQCDVYSKNTVLNLFLQTHSVFINHFFFIQKDGKKGRRKKKKKKKKKIYIVSIYQFAGHNFPNISCYSPSSLFDVARAERRPLYGESGTFFLAVTHQSAQLIICFPLVSAPMVRYSKLAFRLLVQEYKVDLTYTPMILAHECV